MAKFWQRLSILITVESLLLGILCFTPFLMLETNNLTSKKTIFKISIYQYSAISFICLFALFLFIYIIPHFSKQKNRKKEYYTLSAQALLINKTQNLKNETTYSTTKKHSHQINCFNDLSHLNNKDICLLIKKTPENILITALLGADNKTKEIFLKNISPRQLGFFLKHSNTYQSSKIKEIDEAQYFVIKKAHVLINKKRGQVL